MLDYEEAGRRSRLAREWLGLSIPEAAEVTGLSASTIRRCEKPWTPHTTAFPTMFGLAQGYGVSSDWLTGSGPRDPMVRLVDGLYAEEPLAGAEVAR